MRDATSYRFIAPYYDWILGKYDYKAWGEYLNAILSAHGAAPRSILEIGAGTCPFARSRTFPSDVRVVYTDLSPYMLHHGALAAPDVSIVQVAANALALPFKGPFDLCIMVSDVINYLLSERDVFSCFREVHRILAPGALFLFDMASETNSIKYWENCVESDETEGCTFMRHLYYDRETRLQYENFTFFVEQTSGCWKKIMERHVHRIYPSSRLKRLARKAGFTVEAAYGDLTLAPESEASERVHYLLRKPI